MERKPIEKPDLREKGSPRDGQPQALDRRLFMQLLVFGGCLDTHGVIEALESLSADGSFEGVVYEDLNDPSGIGVLTIHEDPGQFLTDLRSTLNRKPFSKLALKPQFTMLGRTYSIGYEPNLADSLLAKPRATALNPDWPWAIWYPLRRSGAFMQLPPEQQREILMEHGTIGRSFGEADYAHDIRLACHGLDTHDSDFVIGLVGRDLHPLSALVQTMRKTTQTSQYLERLGPFFVGKAAWQSRNDA